MEVLIRVEVSTDTADPKITGQEVERVHRGRRLQRHRGSLKAFMTCADLLPRRTDSSRETLRGKPTFLEDMTMLRMGVGTCNDNTFPLMITNESVMSCHTCQSVLLQMCSTKRKPWKLEVLQARFPQWTSSPEWCSPPSEPSQRLWFKSDQNYVNQPNQIITLSTVCMQCFNI